MTDHEPPPDRPIRTSDDPGRPSIGLGRGFWLFMATVATACVVIACLLPDSWVIDNTETPVEPTPVEPTLIVVVPTCADYDRSGYEGLTTCLDADGDLVRPGG